MAGFRYAFGLSKEEVRDAVPPGTTVLVEHALERTTTGTHEHVVDHTKRVPQPSADPADPLNWPMWRKVAVLFCVSVYPFVGNFVAASIASGFQYLAIDFARSGHPVQTSDLTHLIAVTVLFLGISNLWWVPLSNAYGKRTITLTALLIGFACSIWCAKSTTFNSLLAGRIFQGIGAGPSETLCPDVIGEIFFVHQRGRAMAVYTVMLALGPLIGGLSGGYIGAHGWRWMMWVDAILFAFTLVCCFFFQPETLFNRPEAMQQTSITSSIDDASLRNEKVHNDGAMIEHALPSSHFRPYSFTRSLSIGVNRGNLLYHFVGPFKTLRLPGVWMVTLQYAGLVSGVVTLSTVGPQLVAQPPYLWGANAGLINVGGIVGTLLGLITAYLLADWWLKRSARSDSHGYTEPEARLSLLFPGLFFATVGIWTFGFCAANPGPKVWAGLEVGYGMLSFGLLLTPSISFNYLIEAYHAVSGDCFVIVVVVRAVISFCWTFFVGEWIQTDGAAEPFGVFGGLMGFFALLTVPMILYGKRMRIATAKWLPLKEDH